MPHHLDGRTLHKVSRGTNSGTDEWSSADQFSNQAYYFNAFINDISSFSLTCEMVIAVLDNVLKTYGLF